jgi:hypothetical protein
MFQKDILSGYLCFLKYSAVIRHICQNCIRMEELENQWQSRLCWIPSGIKRGNGGGTRNKACKDDFVLVSIVPP